MRYEFNKELVANINHWNMEIDDSGFVYLLHDNWHSEAVCSPYSRLYLVSDGEGQIDAGKNGCCSGPGMPTSSLPGLLSATAAPTIWKNCIFICGW